MQIKTEKLRTTAVVTLSGGCEMSVSNVQKEYFVQQVRVVIVMGFCPPWDANGLLSGRLRHGPRVWRPGFQGAGLI